MPSDAHTPRHDHEACTRAWQTLRRAHDRVARRLAEDLGRECSLAINDVDVLLHLRAHSGGTVRVTDLRDSVPLSQPALSRLVSRLVGRGLVLRSEAADDGRAAAVTLTEAGDALLDRAVAIHAQAVDETLTSKLSDDERAVLLRALREIAH